MTELTATQERRKQRFETLIGVMAPALDLVLAAGERISRIVEPEDYEQYPVRYGEGNRSPIGQARSDDPDPASD